jgi:hypothetical protein
LATKTSGLSAELRSELAHLGSQVTANELRKALRKEYQTAYQLAKEGRQRLALFVREDIWVLRRDRAAIQEFLTNAYRADKELSEREIQEIVNHPSPMATNVTIVQSELKPFKTGQKQNFSN